MKKVSDHSNCLLDSHFIWNLLEKWEPQSFALTEKEQEEDLFNWLKINLPEVPMIQQYGIARGSADIIIQDSFLIELKLPFTDQKRQSLIVVSDSYMNNLETTVAVKETWWINGAPRSWLVQAAKLPTVEEDAHYPKVVALLLPTSYGKVKTSV